MLVAARARRSRAAAALLGGVVFCLMPYRVGQSTGHLLGPVSFLLPAMLLALERRRFVVAAACLVAPSRSPASSTSRSERSRSRSATRGRGCRARAGGRRARARRAALVAGLVVDRWAIVGLDRDGPVVRPGRPVLGGALRLRHAARSEAGIEELVFVGWLTPAPRRRRARRDPEAARACRRARSRGAAFPACSRSARTSAGYETVWRRRPRARRDARPGARACRSRALRSPLSSPSGSTQATVCYKGLSTASRLAALAAAGDPAVLAVDLRVPVFGAVAADTPNAAYAAMRGRGSAARAPGLPAGRPLRQRVPRLRAPEPAGAAAGLLDGRAPSRRSGSRASCAGSRAGAGRSPPASGSASSPFTAASTPRAASSRRLRRAGGGAAPAHGWRLLARDGPISHVRTR